MEEPTIAKLSGWLTIPEAAAILGLGRAAVHKQIREGKIPSTAVRRAGPVLLINELVLRQLGKDRLAAALEKSERSSGASSGAV